MSPALDPPLVVVTGPTAVGKSALALGLAERFDAEIVSADSRLVYRGLDVGTAKPSPAEQARAPHHLIDLVEPDQPFPWPTTRPPRNPGSTTFPGAAAWRCWWVAVRTTSRP